MPLVMPNRAQQMRLAAAALLLIVLVAAGFFINRQPDWKVLYVNLSDKDGGAVLAQLSQLNIPYKNAEGGAIMVPAEKVHETRLRLATLGLPKGSTVGFELMDSSRFGMTQFQERLTFQRGLEGELTRSIQSLGTVQAARIHLALPNQNGFFREQQKPSASVLLSLHPGRSLDRMQVAGIVHLVASSVSELDPKAVSVVDDAGNLLSSPADATLGANSQQMQHVKQLEQSYVQRIQDILAPVVGRQNVKAQVTLEVDFSEKEMTQQIHTPNQLESAVRSKQLVENGNGVSNTLAAGVPGAASNQPSPLVTSPINGPAQNLDFAGGAGALNGKRESVINYEVDRTTRVVREASGVLKRVSAAVVINHQAQGEGAATVTKPLAPEQLAQMTALVRDAVGYQPERGDSVNLMNAAFNVEKMPEAPLLAWWQQSEMQSLFRSLAWLLGSVLVAALAFFILVRPMLRGLRKEKQPVEPLLDAVAAEVPERPPVASAVALTPPPPALVFAPMDSDDRLIGARKFAIENPAAVADIMKSWINGDPV
jgi:flagellar M-ring protein FliF